MAKRGRKPQIIHWAVIQIAISSGRKVTEASLYEEANCIDGSLFCICPDHPQGPNRPLRLWPHNGG